MRRAVLILFYVSFAAVPLSAAEPFRWQPPFQPLRETSSSPQASNKIVVSVITNDDPHRLKRDDAESWCEGLLQRRYASLLERRPDLSDQLLFQLVPAGRPSIVTGGESRNQPARVVIAFCDEEYRLLSLCVGIPDADELQTRIEDVQEVRSLRQQDQTDRTQIQQQIAARAAERLPRRWKQAMTACLQEASNISLQAEPTAGTESASLGTLMSSERALAELAPVYQKDVSMRFGLSEPSDWVRLGILEQHPETRREWCEAILPALIDLDWETIWKPVVGSTWHQPPFRPQSLDSEIMAWFDRHVSDGRVALTVGEKPPNAYDSLLQLVSNEARKERHSGWAALRDRVEAMPYRLVSLEQLVALLDEHEIQPIDLEQPSPVRYLIFESVDAAPLLIRYADSPSVWLRRLKRQDAAKP